MDYTSEFVQIPTEDLRNWPIVGSPDYTHSMYMIGVLHPILVAIDDDDKTHLIAGNRRIASHIAAYDKAVADGTLEDRPWLKEIPARVFRDVDPTDQATWSLIENQERGDNIVLTFLTLQKLEADGKWDEVKEILKVNKNVWDKFRKLGEAEPELIEAFSNGKIAETSLMQAASLPKPKQAYLLDVLQKQGKVTGKDVRAAKVANQQSILELLNIDVSAPVVEMPTHIFVGVKLDDLSVPVIGTDFHEINQACLSFGYKMYRLVEV